MSTNEPVRLQKLLANHGIASRRVIEEMIVEGRIYVNDEMAILGTKASLDDKIEIDDSPVVLNSEKKYFLLNKPLGVISTAFDEQGRQSVVDLIDTDLRIFPVGRLDANTTGLIILTNDGELTHRLTHPSYGIEKKYVAELEGEVSDATIELLRNGVDLDDGKTSDAKVRISARKTDVTLIEITIHEGRNRQIRRMGEAINHKVISLNRIGVGPIADQNLKVGEYRELNPKEIFELFDATKDKSENA